MIQHISSNLNKFQNELGRRLSSSDEWLQILSLLDPRFKHLSFVESQERQNVWTKLKELSDSTPVLDQPPKKHVCLIFQLTDCIILFIFTFRFIFKL